MGINASVVNDKRYMLQFRFWLNGVNSLEAALADQCEYLKSIRQFQPIVRNALRLYLDLRQGNTEVLKELFPFVLQAQPEPARTLAPVQVDNLADKMEVTQSQADKWGEAKGRHNLLCDLNADDPRHWDNIPTDSFEYGLEVGKFPAALVSQAHQVLAERQKPRDAAPGSIRQIAGSDTPLTAPLSENDDLLDLLE